MDIARAVRYTFEDERWVTKLLLGALIMLIPFFGGLALSGYVVAIVRNVKAGLERPLPEWNDLGTLFTDGLKLWVAELVYNIPIWILLCPITVIWFLPLLSGNDEQTAVILASAAGIVSLGLACIVTLYFVLMCLVMPAVIIRYAETGEIGACLHIGEVFRFAFSHIGQILLTQVLLWAAGLVVGAVVSAVGGALSLIPVCGWATMVPVSLLFLPFNVLVTIFSGHLYGQIAGRAAPAVL